MRNFLWVWLTAAWLLTPTYALGAPVAAAVVAFFQLTGVAATIATFVVETVIAIAVNAVANKLFGPKVASSAAQQRQASVLSLAIGEGPREAIFGRAATGGLLLDAFNFGGANDTDWEVIVIKVADHRCDAFEGYFIGDTFYAWSADGAQSGFNSQLEVYWKNGAPGQTASSYLLTNSASRLYGTAWESTDVAKSMAYVIFAYKADDPNAANPVWPQGRPQFKAVVRGKLCYDPRKDSTVAGGSGSHRWATPSTWEWSENAAVCDYNYDRGIFAEDAVTDPTALLVGRGLSAQEADPARVAARANLCDEAVGLKAGGTEPRYRVGGVVFANQTFGDVKQMFATAMGGDIVKRQGGVEVLPGAAQSVVREITDLDLVVGEVVSYQPFLSDNDRVNTVIGHYNAPDQLWANVTAPVRRSTADIAADGGQKTADVAGDLITSQTQMQRVCEIKRRRGRREKRAALVLTPPHADLEDGDWIGWTSDRYFGGERVVFQIGVYAVQQSWRNNLALLEIASDCFDWVAADDEGVPGLAPVDEFGGLDPVALAGVSIVAFALTADDGSVVPAIKATWTAPADPAIRGVRLEVRKVSTTDVTLTATDQVSGGLLITADGVLPGTSVQGRLVPLAIQGRKVTASSWTTITTDALLIAELAAAVGDGLLTSGEKLSVVPTIQGLVSARTDLDARGAALSVSTTAYDAAATALDTQLAGLTSPVDWDDSSDYTVVSDPAGLRTALQNAIAEEKAIISAIALHTPVSGPNLFRYSEFEKGTHFWPDSSNPSGITRLTSTGVSAGLNYLDCAGSATASTQVLAVSTADDPFSVLGVKQLAFQMRVGTSNCLFNAAIEFFDAAGAFLATSTTGLTAGNSTAFATLQQVMIDVPTGAATAFMVWAITSVASGFMHGNIVQPSIVAVPKGQVAFPPYVRGPSNDPAADVTALNPSASIIGQGDGATANIYRQSTDPTLAGAVPDKSTWFDTSTSPPTQYLRDSGSWELVTAPAYVITGTASPTTAAYSGATNGTKTTNGVTITPAGGPPGETYDARWVLLDGDGETIISISGKTSFSESWSAAMTAGATFAATWRCWITGVTSKAFGYVDVPVNLTDTR